MTVLQMTLPGLDTLSLPLQNLILVEVDGVLDTSPGGYAYNLLLDAWLDPLLNESRLVLATYANQPYNDLDEVGGCFPTGLPHMMATCRHQSTSIAFHQYG